MDVSRVTRMLVKHEGLRLTPYRDTVGKLTVGVGRNLDDVGVSQEEAMFLLGNDLGRAIDSLRRTFDWFGSLDEVRQAVLIDMCFNLGVGGLGRFKMMLGHCVKGEWDAAAVEMLDSKWGRQVGGRARELAKMMETGEWSDE